MALDPEDRVILAGKSWRDVLEPATNEVTHTLTSAFLALPDHSYVVGVAVDPATHGPTLHRRDADGRPGAPFSSMDELRSAATMAQCGRGTETVMDLTARRTLRVAPDQVHVAWPGTDAALARIATVLGDAPLTAELHDVLIYDEGCFFREHRDAKKHPQHQMTLVVDCGMLGDDGTKERSGGAVVFLSDEKRGVHRPSKSLYHHYDVSESSQDDQSECSDLNETGSYVYDPSDSSNSAGVDDDASDDARPKPRLTRKLGRWRSVSRGDWCAWYTSVTHRVTQLRRGVRVVAVFNLLSDELDDDGIQVAPEWQPARDSNSSAQSAFIHQLPSEVLEEIGFFLPFAELRCLGRTCWRMRHFFGPPRAFGIVARRVVPKITKEYTERACDRFGFVLQHQYSTDGNESVPLANLRGRDTVLVETLAKVLGKSPRVMPIAVVIERPEDRPTWYIHIGGGGLVADDVPYKEQLQYEDNLHIRYELDQSDPILFTSRLADEEKILWLSSLRYASTVVKTQVVEHFAEHLWGNAATFSIYFYKSCAVFFQ